MAVFTRFSGGFCIRRVCVAPAAPTPLWAVPWPPGHEKRTPTAADAHDLKIVVKLRAVPASKVPFPVEIAWFPDFSRPVPVYPAFLKYVVPVHRASRMTSSTACQIRSSSSCSSRRCGAHWSARRKRRAEENREKHLPSRQVLFVWSCRFSAYKCQNSVSSSSENSRSLTAKRSMPCSSP